MSGLLMNAPDILFILCAAWLEITEFGRRSFDFRKNHRDTNLRLPSVRR